MTSQNQETSMKSKDVMFILKKNVRKSIRVCFLLPDASQYLEDKKDGDFMIEIETGVYFGIVLKTLYQYMKSQKQHEEFMTKYKWFDVSLDDTYFTCFNKPIHTDGKQIYIITHNQFYYFDTIWICCVGSDSLLSTPLCQLLLSVK